MSYLSTPGSPIYDQLVQEQGDVLAEARKLAEEALQQADPAQYWHGASARRAPGKVPQT
ncbi:MULTISPECIES: hypothetical protein [unclassified Streptomyces]|uniref:hypothetical protein n=1 Tax=unclassified Streptomyces TaxID=2593676 RepID=UPI002E1592FC|nr:hypothetical protein OG452_05725 [Streptomyces sp. NBC_01197]WSS52439.1 hypothetical protein OG708_29685 [Streptomyces sp. NBC_01180]